MAPEQHSNPTFPSRMGPCVPQALCLAAAIVCLVDATLVTKMVRKAMKKALGLEGEAKASPAGEEPHQPPKPESEKMLSPAPPEPAAVGPALAKEAVPAP